MTERSAITCFASRCNPPSHSDRSLPLCTQEASLESRSAGRLSHDSTIRHYPVRLLYHHRTQGGGVEAVHVRGMANAFSELAITCDVLGPPGVRMEECARPASASNSRPALRTMLRSFAARAPEGLFELGELGYNLLALPRLLAACRRRRYGLLYERYALFLLAGAVVARLLRLPFVLEVNDSVTIERSRPLRWRCMATAIERWVLRSADLVVTVSHPFRRRLLGLGLADERVIVVPNAVDPAQWPEGRPKPIAADSQPVVIACVAAFVHWHRPDFLIESSAELLRDRNARLLLIGEGPFRPVAEALAGRMGCLDRVTFTGHLPHDRVRQLLAGADIAVIPHSNEHGSPMKLFEYMAAGKPVVAPACPPIKEIIDDGSTGLLFEPLSAASMGQKLRLLVDQPDLRLRLGLNARRKVLAEHTWRRNAQKVLAILNMWEVACW